MSYFYTRSKPFLSAFLDILHGGQAKSKERLRWDGERTPSQKQGVGLSEERDPKCLAKRKTVFYWNKLEVVSLSAKMKILLTRKWFKSRNLLASGSCNLPGGVRSRLLQADAWGIRLLSRWLCEGTISYVWFLESVKPSAKLLVLQSRRLREGRVEENNTRALL